jgi:hypothetical protein
MVQKSIRKMWSGDYGDEEIQFCEARIEVLARSPDRIKALGSALNLQDGAQRERLTTWAIYQLDAMKSPQADAELDRFMEQIRKLPDDSPARDDLSPHVAAIQNLQMSRGYRSK